MNINNEIWFGINKDGSFAAFSEEPHRNNKTGRWEGNYPFIGSTIYNELKGLVEKSNITWESDIEVIVIK